MASELLGDRFTILSVVPLEETNTDDFTVYRSVDIDGAGTTSMEPGIFSGQGRAAFFAMSSFPISVVDTTPILPESSDPPFPPVYPYFFSTDLLYGREKMNTVIRFVRGDKYPFTATVVIDGEAYNLTDTTMTMTAKWAYEDADGSAVFQKTVGDGITYTDATNGVAQIVILPADTSALPAVEGGVILKYDIELVDGAAKFTVARGDLLVLPDVTTGA